MMEPHLISCPNILLIGSADRNLGKTEFVCELIRRHIATHPVIGVKITSIRERNGCCPRGGQGCGLCNALEGDYLITEEILTGKNEDEDKDTARMLRAGASQVFWLKVLHEHLESGVKALLARLPQDALIVCESNSARAVLEPGLFLVVRQAGSNAMKSSLKAVVEHADRLLDFDGQGWDFEPCRITVANGRWIVRPDASAVILAGGKSMRMHEDKSLLEIRGQPMIDHIAEQLAFFPECLIGANEPEKYAFLNLPVVPDQEPDQGPLMGILSCVDRAAFDLCFVTGCDIPELDLDFIMDLLARAKGKDIVLPRYSNGRVEPMLGVYRKTVVPVARAILRRGGRRVVELLEHLEVDYLPIERLAWYSNLNTQEEYQQWRSQQDSRQQDKTGRRDSTTRKDSFDEP
ncbi:MAG: molybdenum cofactor guanylyltransferase [Pirellulales bacterium]|nr:molybdenum cofactor guanylyltransferase [Pirellulales bacterium]